MSLEKDGEIDQFTNHSNSLGLSKISLNEAKDKAPIINLQFVKQASWRDDVYDIDTDLLIQTLRKECLKNGVQILTNLKVKKLERVNKIGFKSQFQSEILINASGAWADKIAQLASLKPKNIQPYKRSMARVEIDTIMK